MTTDDEKKIAERAERTILLEALAVDVTEMRRLQKAWFGGDKSSETLHASKRAERAVDAALSRLEAGPPAQRRLF